MKHFKVKYEAEYDIEADTEDEAIEQAGIRMDADLVTGVVFPIVTEVLSSPSRRR